MSQFAPTATRNITENGDQDVPVEQGFWYGARIAGTWSGATVTPKLAGRVTTGIPAPGETNLDNAIALTADGFFRFFAVTPTLRLTASSADTADLWLELAKETTAR